MAFKFDLRGFLITRKSDDAEPKKVNITNNYFNAEKEEVKNKKEITEKVVNKPTAPTFPQRQPIVEPRIVLNLNQESLKEGI